MKISGAKGFALIELLVVLSIIGVLSGMVLVSVSEAKEKARDTKRVQEITQINTAIQLYKSDHEGKAPTFNGACSYDVQDLGPHNGYCVAISGEITGNAYNPWEAFKDEIKDYMNNDVPEDPCGSNCGDGFGYVYIAPAALESAQSNEDYQIYATLERTTNKKTGVSTTDDDFEDPPEDEDTDDTTPPTIPTGVTFYFDDEWENGHLGVHISWDASSDLGGSGIEGYLIPQIDLEEYVPQHEPTPGTIRDYFVQDWSQGSDVCYQVKAVDNAGNVSGLSEPVCAVVPINYLPLEKPINLSVNNTNYPMLQFGWEHPVDTYASSISYEVYKSGNPTPVIANQFTSLAQYHAWNVNDSGLFWTNTFCYTVRAKATNPNTSEPIYSEMSDQFCAEPPAPPPSYSVSMPGNLQAVFNQNGSISFTWSASASTYPFPNSISSYYIYKYTNGTYIERTSTSQLSYTATPAFWGSSFCWAMKARDAGNHFSATTSPVCVSQ